MAVGHRGGPLNDVHAIGGRSSRQPTFRRHGPGTSVRALTDAACAQAGITLRPRFEVTHLATAGALVAAGLGVTALPALTCRSSVAAPSSPARSGSA